MTALSRLRIIRGKLSRRGLPVHSPPVPAVLRRPILRVVLRQTCRQRPKVQRPAFIGSSKTCEAQLSRWSHHGGFFLAERPIAALRCQRAANKGVRIVATGTVKLFNPTKGFGFIQPDNGGKDVFVYISAVEKAGLSNLNEGAKVSYEVVANRGKESAENLRVG